MQITFDDLNKEIAESFDTLSVDFGGEVVEFANPQLLERKERDEVRELINIFIEGFFDEDGKLLEERANDEEEAVESIAAVLRQVCVSGNFGLVEAELGKVFVKWMFLWGTWNKALQVGEA